MCLVAELVRRPRKTNKSWTTNSNLANCKCAGVVIIDETLNTLSLQIESTDISLPELLRGVIFGVKFVPGNEDRLTICVPYTTCGLFLKEPHRNSNVKLYSVACTCMFLQSYGYWVALESFEVFVSTCNIHDTCKLECDKMLLCFGFSSVLPSKSVTYSSEAFYMPPGLFNENRKENSYETKLISKSLDKLL